MNEKLTLQSERSDSESRTRQSKCGCAETNALALALKALAHPSRIEIIRQLANRDRCCGGDFCDCMPLSQSTISQHLDLLKQAGLVKWQQQGTRSIYTLNRQAVATLARQLDMLAKQPPQKAEE